jgi:hypothetical protein
VAQHDAAGFDSELQVRYHPPSGEAGDVAAWVAYVCHVVDVFGRDRRVVAMTITNEVNLDVSQNTSDGAYAGARAALVQGILAARAEADRIGRRSGSRSPTAGARRRTRRSGARSARHRTRFAAPSASSGSTTTRARPGRR